MGNQIIWQPKDLYQSGCSFSILLDPTFAKEMFDSKLSEEKYQKMQELPKKLMSFKYPDTYVFHEDTCLIRRINLYPGNGQWLSMDDVCGGVNFDKPIKYSTHNFDSRISSSDVTTLMGLFELWIEYSELLKKNK